MVQAVCVNAVLAKIKNIFQEEESIRQNRESKNFRKAFSEPVLSEPMFSEGEIKAKPYRSLPEKPDHLSDQPKPPASMQSNKIQVLHSVFDQSDFLAAVHVLSGRTLNHFEFSSGIIVRVTFERFLRKRHINVAILHRHNVNPLLYSFGAPLGFC